MDILIGILEQGLIYSIMVLGIYITYIILDFPDLTVDGSFPLGAVVSVTIIRVGGSPILGLIAGFLSGAVIGIITGIIHVKLGVKDLLSGIIVMTGLYTINLMIGGKSNVAIFDSKTIFNNSFINQFSNVLKSYSDIVVILPIVLICAIALTQYLKTKNGLLLRSIGDNQNLVKMMAVDPGKLKILGLGIANSLVALSGAVLAQQQRFSDVSQGTGIMVMGLTSIIIGMRIFQPLHNMPFAIKAILGSIIYKAVVSASIALGLSANSLKLITAVILLIVLVLSKDDDKKSAEKLNINEY
ncbi:MAG: ABC transporter permease [Clostridiaceae bacterium]|nr:ABC transporter permease [Clostridiaceae bacterium]